VTLIANREFTSNMKRKQLEKAGIQAVKVLRRTKLSMGFPFMINTHLLSSDQCYLEYPDGSIKLVALDRNNHDLKVIRELSSEDNSSVRKMYTLR
jgi:hypothetical protein